MCQADRQASAGRWKEQVVFRCALAAVGGIVTLRTATGLLLRCRRGASLVEFVLISWLIGIIIFAVVDVGKVTYQYITLTQSLTAGGQFLINHASSYSQVPAVIAAALPTNWTNVTIGAPSFFCQSAQYSCANPPANPSVTPLSAASCDSTGQSVYLTASRPNTSILMKSFGSTVNACYVARFQ